MEMELAKNLTVGVAAAVAASSNALIGPVKDATSKTKATPCNDKNSKLATVQLVTGEKMTSNNPATTSDEKNASECRQYAASFAVTCPDGSIVHLSSPDGISRDGTSKNNDNDTPTTSQIVLGRGTYGIPSSASHVSRQACVLRLILDDEDGSSGNNTSCVTSENNNDNSEHNNVKQYALELVVLGSQPCRITRRHQSSSSTEEEGENSKVFFAKSISQLIADGNNDFSPSSVKIRNGDIIEPCYRPLECTLDDAKEQGCHHPFTVHFVTNDSIAQPVVNLDEEEKEKSDTAALFSEASRKIEAAAAILSEERKEAEEEVVVDQEEQDEKENSQDTVDVKSVMVKDDVEMDEKDAEKTISEDVTMDTAAVASEANEAGMEVEEKEGEEEVSADTGAETEQKKGEKVVSSKVTDVSLPVEATSTSASTPNEETKSSLEESSEEEEEEEEEEYDFVDPRQEIIDILQEIDSPGTFAVGGSCDGKLIMPGLVVDGIGPIGLPLSQSQAKELRNRCEQAPFGRGAKTIVDKSVRDTFQLAPEFFQITNPAWKKDLDAITKSVCLDLGVQSNLKVEARLYKMLLYEEGSFFAPHRDSEKEEGMFGTLVIVLPSQFTGGELVVKHKGETETFRQGELSTFGSQYAAFYADCKHELKKVTSGHRLCIVYNLVKCGVGMLPTVADNSSLLKRLHAAASQWADEFDGNKIVLMTDHLYTPAGIKNGTGSAKYKGADAYVVELLQSAIRKGADIDYDHGTLSLSESGTGESDYDYGWGGGYSYYWGETTDRDLSLNLDSYGVISVDEEEEVIPENFFEDLEPEDESFEPTGNAGVEAERQYADSEAIVVWPRSKRWTLVTNNDTSRMCSYLLKACTKGTSDSETTEECLQKAKSIIARVVVSSKADNSAFMKSIVMIGDKELPKTFISSYLKVSERSIAAIADHIQSFVDLCGVEAITPLIVESFVTTRFVSDPTGTANFVLKYVEYLPQEQKENVIAAFVDSMCPQDKSTSRPLKSSLDGFPLCAILALFGDNGLNNGSLAKRVIEGYVWLSCLEIKTSIYSNVTKPADGPVLLTSVASSVVKLCESFGWAEFKDVLISAVQKLCQRDKSEIAHAFIESLAPKDEGKSDRSDTCCALAGAVCDMIVKSLNTERFVSDPTGTANFVLRYLEKFGKKVVVTQEQRENVIAAFVDSMCPQDKSTSRPLKSSLDGFPLCAVLALFGDHGPNNGSLAKRVIEGYAWISCQQIQIQRSSYSYSYSHSSSTKPAEGPVLLTSATHSIVKLCESFGWAEFKPVLISAVQKLCERGKAEVALAFVESLAPKVEGKSDRSDICSELAEVVCDKALTSFQTSLPNDAAKSTRLTDCKKLVIVIGKFCPSKAPKFAQIAKSLDIDSILFPLVTDPTLRSHASDCVISSLDALTRHCSHVLSSRLSVDTGNVTIWSLSNASLSKHSSYFSFIKSPCKRVLDWQVRKADHAGFFADLRGLIQSRDIKAESYQPGGRGLYHFRITKLKSRTVPASSVAGIKCSCSSGSSSYSRYSSYRTSSATPTDCLLSKHKAVVSKYKEDLKKMNAIKALLPSATALAGQPQQSGARSSQQFDVVYKTSTLGLKMNLMNRKDIVVTEVTSTAPNGHMIKAGDFLVGLNGKRFEELGIKIGDSSTYKLALDKLRNAQRPMTVMFERRAGANVDKETTRKRPAATHGASSALAGGEKTSQVGVDAQSQHPPPAKKAKEAEIIDLT